MFARNSKAPYVCSRCLFQQRARRLYSTDNPTSPPPPPSSGAAKLTTRRLISLHGLDTPKFLQGIITNNVRTSGPEATKGFYAAFLTAQGKVLHDSFIYPTLGSEWHARQANAEEPGYLVEVDAEQADVLMKHLKRHKLRSKFKLRMVDEGELDVYSLWREGDRWTAHGSQEGTEGVLGLTDARAPGMGQRLILPGEGGKTGLALDGVEEVPLSAYTIRRFMRGVPEGQKEMPRDDCLPMNCNIDLMGGIDFKKGCYLGQELTIRTHHTGVVRRRTLPVAIYEHGSEPPEKLEYDSSATFSNLNGADIRRDDKRKRSTGKLIASVGNVGLGMCRLEQMSDLTISGEPSSFTSEDRFLVQDASGRELSVKAFVPDWVRGSIRGPKVQKRV